MSSDNFTQGHSMKIKWMETNVAAVGSPHRVVERAILVVILAGRVFAISSLICGNIVM